LWPQQGGTQEWKIGLSKHHSQAPFRWMREARGAVIEGVNGERIEEFRAVGTKKIEQSALLVSDSTIDRTARKPFIPILYDCMLFSMEEHFYYRFTISMSLFLNGRSQ